MRFVKLLTGHVPTPQLVHSEIKMTNGHHSSLHINVSCTAWLPLDRTLPVDYCSAHPQPCVHLVCFTRLIGGKGKRPQPQGTASGIRTLKASSEQGATIAVYITCTGSPGRRKRSKGTKGTSFGALQALHCERSCWYRACMRGPLLTLCSVIAGAALF